MQKIAFIGLGVMGYPIAGHLAHAGHDVCVFNRAVGKRDKWLRDYSGRWASSPGDAAVGADIVFCCVGGDQDLREVAFAPQGILSSIQRGAVLVDHTTTSATVAREVAQRCDEKGVGFVDAPLSGGQAGAQHGSLAIMCGGAEEHYQKVQIVMACYGKRIVHLGGVGNGQLTKMANQICIAGLLQGLSEGIAFAKNAGLDPLQVLDAIGEGAAGSWQMHNRGATMAADDYDFGFAVDWMRKDLAICLDEARVNRSDLPVAKLVDGFYAEIQTMGGQRWDTSSLLRRLPK